MYCLWRRWWKDNFLTNSKFYSIIQWYPFWYNFSFCHNFSLTFLYGYSAIKVSRLIPLWTLSQNWCQYFTILYFENAFLGGGAPRNLNCSKLNLVKQQDVRIKRFMTEDKNWYCNCLKDSKPFIKPKKRKKKQNHGPKRKTRVRFPKITSLFYPQNIVDLKTRNIPASH